MVQDLPPGTDLDGLLRLGVEIRDEDSPPSNAVTEYYGYNFDLNHGYRGPYAWITAEYGDCSLHSGLASDPVEPRIWQDTKEWEGRTDYAAGTGGMYRYVYAVKVDWANRIHRVKLMRSTFAYTAERLKNQTGYRYSSGDLNAGRGEGVNGDADTYMYLIWD